LTEKKGSKSWALYTGLIFLLLAVLGYVFRGELLGGMVAWRIGPDKDFNALEQPSGPDYSDSNYWAALPDKPNASQDRPTHTDGSPLSVSGTADTASTTSEENPPVFFVHPTSYFGKANWNQALTDEDANWIVDQRVMRHQASVFNSCCTVYAPRYRQATFYSFIENGSNAEQALGLAFDDVLAAFENFIERIPNGQPFILAGHSQGTRHSTQLLREHIANTELQKRLIAAYLIGFSISKDDLGGIPVCESARATGCAVGWNSIEGNGRGIFASIDNLMCVNPLSWKIDGVYAPHDNNTGAIGFAGYGPTIDGEDVTAMVIEPGAADAHCKNGQLFVPELRAKTFPQRMQGNSMHLYDYSLFHMNIRANAVERVTAFMDAL